MTKNSVQQHVVDGVIIVGGALSPWWTNYLQPTLSAIVLICTAVLMLWRVWKLFMQFLTFIGLRQKKMSRKDDWISAEDD